ncbi:MAG: MBL fold metallo-hydrolase [Myxococcota bacterium]
MKLGFLGHASWFLESGGLRLVTDPVLSEAYHDGVFEVFPRRTVDVDGLDPNVIVVTHRHPDHFDVPTLHLLGQRFPHAHVLTSDPLVVEVCEAFGFREVSLVDERTVVALPGGVRMYTTPSLCRVVEWGVLFAGPGGTVWNLVDSAVRSPDDVRAMLAGAAGALGLPELAEGPDVALVRWCPLRQADGATSGTLGFPWEEYAQEVRNAAATGARTLIPGSCGDRYTGSSAWQNRSVYPVTESRFLADLAVLAPRAERFPPRVGASWRLVDGRFHEEAPLPWVTVHASPDDRIFAPFVLPDIVDPAPPGFDEERALATVAVWCGDVLAPALQVWAASCSPDRDLSLVVELVFPSRTVALTFRAGPGGARVDVGADPDHDGLERVAGSVLLDVIEARSHWGRALLGGWMRSVRRGYRMLADGSMQRLDLPAFVLYLGCSYAESTERWTRAEVERLLGRPS